MCTALARETALIHPSRPWSLRLGSGYRFSFLFSMLLDHYSPNALPRCTGPSHSVSLGRTCVCQLNGAKEAKTYKRLSW